MNLFFVIVPFVLVFASSDAVGGDVAYNPSRHHTLDQINVQHRLLQANGVFLLQQNLEIQEASQTTIRSNVSTRLDVPAKDICFVHVGKCGGESINNGLEQLKENGDISSLVQVHGPHDEVPGRIPGPVVGHSFEQCASSGNVLLWVRDPVSRFVSIWKFFADPGYTKMEIHPEKPRQRDEMRALIVDNSLNDTSLAPVADNPSTLTQVDMDRLVVNLFSMQNSTLQHLFFNTLPHGSTTLSWYLDDCAALAILPIVFVGTVDAMDVDWERFLQDTLRVQYAPLPHEHNTNYANQFLSQSAVSSLRQWHAKDYLCLAKLVDARWLPISYLDDVTSTTKHYAY